MVAMVASEVAWSLPAAGAVVTGWALGTAGWLHSRNWAAGAVLAVLAAPGGGARRGGRGWLADPGGLVLWGPVGAVLATATAMAAHP